MSLKKTATPAKNTDDRTGRVTTARPPLAPVRRHYSLFAANGGEVVGLGTETPSLPRPLLRGGKARSARCPAPPRPPSVPPALSGSCLLLLLLLPVVQAPPSLLSFAARISLEFYSLPHVTHRVKLHLRRVTHQHSASPSRPGHRQQQPPRTEEPQPGSQPAPPSAECAAAAHGNSRVRPEELERPRPPALEAELAEALRFPSGEAQGFSREWEGEGGLGPAWAGRSDLSPIVLAAKTRRRRKPEGGSGAGVWPAGEIQGGVDDCMETPARVGPGGVLFHNRLSAL
ncbi:uncharacterized protein LOC111828079 [Myotis lucifugus]|uniref:uncharacterized protein LOC111828079 n=1 Tax=Myotis lucifugus TaxID=59463 RepID=UPI000CCC7A20|nr:uncharacterized protein LOC111828079 [Myotis lucifugus]